MTEPGLESEGKLPGARSNGLRIAMLIRSLGRGGAERQVAVLSRELKNAGHEVSVFCFYRRGGYEEELLAAGVNVIFLEKRGRWDLVGFFARLRKNLKEFSPDVLYSFLPVPNIMAAAVKRFLRGTRIVWGIRDSNVRSKKGGIVYNLVWRVQRMLARQIDLVIVNSSSATENCVRNGFPSDRMTTIHNGIATDLFVRDEEARTALRKEWGVDRNTLVIGLVARLDPIKGHSVFSDAARRFIKEHHNTLFVCVGGGPPEARNAFMEETEKKGLHGHLLMFWDRKDMPAVYSSFDLFTLSSFSEGFPNVICEAMACGTPCVVTNAGDSARIVGETGVVVPVGDPDALTKGWQQLLHSLDDDGCGSMCRDRIVSQFSLARMVRATEGALCKLL